MANFKKESEIVNVFCPFTVLKNSFSVAKLKCKIFTAEQFYTCREVFHDDFPRYKNILISTPKYKLIRLLNLFNVIESKLNLNKKSKIYLTQRKNLYYVRLSRFWNVSLRYNLLTLLIRSGLKIKSLVNIDELKQHNKYLKITQSAFDLFFSGFIQYKGKKNTWYKCFNNKTNKECRKFLYKT